MKKRRTCNARYIQVRIRITLPSVKMRQENSSTTLMLKERRKTLNRLKRHTEEPNATPSQAPLRTPHDTRDDETLLKLPERNSLKRQVKRTESRLPSSKPSSATWKPNSREEFTKWPFFTHDAYAPDDDRFPIHATHDNIRYLRTSSTLCHNRTLGVAPMQCSYLLCVVCHWFRLCHWFLH